MTENQAPEQQEGALAAELFGGEGGEDMHPLLKWIVDHVRLLATCLAAVLVIGAGIGGYNYYKREALNSASAELGAILTEKSGKELVSALDGYTSAAPEAMVPAVLFELAKASLKEKDYDTAMKAWDKLSARVGDDAIWVVKLGRAQTLSLSGKTAEALPILQDVKDNGPKTYTASVNQMLATQAEKSGDLALALSAYQDLLASNTDGQRKAFIEYKISQLNKKLEKKS